MYDSLEAYNGIRTSFDLLVDLSLRARILVNDNSTSFLIAIQTEKRDAMKRFLTI